MNREDLRGGEPIMKADNLPKRLKRRLAANGPGLTVAVVAMLIALTGGAFAAAGALNAKQKKEVKKIAQTEAKKFATAGPAGPQGATGAPGPKGDQGVEGKRGADGASGKSVEVAPIATEDPFECEERGGALVKEEGAPSGIEVCSGEAGAKGEPWAPDNTLPPGATETGAWAFTGTASDTNGIRVALTLPVQFPFALKAEHVHFSTEAGFATPCPGTAAAPIAEPGELCVYDNTQEEITGTTFDGIYKIASLEAKGLNRGGAMLVFTAPTGAASGSGSFAVQACTKEAPPVECPAGS
jgi:hypothetical protein